MSSRQAPCTPPADHLKTRDAGTWTRDKLEILAYYLPGFTSATKRARERYFVDGFAGPGVNVIKESHERLCGSPLIALHTQPPFTRCLFLDLKDNNIRALRARTTPFGDRAIVERGDVNTHLVGLMHQHVNRAAPTLCLLDQEGMDVHWRTIRDLARFRTGTGKVELLILFNAPGLRRLLPLYEVRHNRSVLDAFFGGNGWQAVYENVRSAGCRSDEAELRYVQYYEDKLRQLGYTTTLHRPIRDDQGLWGRIRYWLVFATTHPAGATIMNDAFSKVFPRQTATPLPGIEPARPRRIRSRR